MREETRGRPRRGVGMKGGNEFERMRGYFYSRVTTTAIFPIVGGSSSAADAARCPVPAAVVGVQLLVGRDVAPRDDERPRPALDRLGRAQLHEAHVVPVPPGPALPAAAVELVVDVAREHLCP